jgi:hypothetical protein
MTQATMTESSRDANALSLACLAHLEQEEAMLGATLDSLKQVRAALVGGDLSALQRAVEYQGHTARAANELKMRRAQLRSQLGAGLGLDPRAVTLQEVSSKLPLANADRIARCRERLHQMAAEVDRLNRGNAALVQYSMDFLHQFLISLTGVDPVGDRYRPSGQIERETCGSVFEGRA